MILPIIFVPLVYGLSSTPDACAVPPDSRYGNTCTTSPDFTEKTCCWREKIPGQILGKEYCQTCKRAPNTNEWTDCKPKVAQLTTPPTTGENVLPGGGLAEQPEQPPLFGRNEGAVPPTGGIVQPFAPAPGFQPLTPRPFTSTPFQQIPQGQQQPFTSTPFQQIPQGQQQPLFQPLNPLTPTPLPTPSSPPPPLTPTGPTVAPQADSQTEGLPTIENQENVPPGGGVAEQPEDDGQEDSSEGVETAGPLT